MMKNKLIICILILLGAVNAKAIKVKFIAANMSVNVAEGSIGAFTAFQVYPSSFTQLDSLDLIELINFPSINYNDIKEVVIEKTMLSENNSSSFEQLATFIVLDSVVFGNYTDEDFIQGNTYAYRISVITNTEQQLNLIQKSVTGEIADLKMNCAKVNNVYRLAGHNNFQESVISPQNGGFYQTMFFTRVVELDVHTSNNPTTWNWNVRHIGSGNKNNCGYGTTGDKTFGICIDDIKQWHNNYPNHDLIILFIDLKSDWNTNNNNQTPADLDQRLLSLVPADMIYKPRDLLGNTNSSNFGNMRLAAQQNNWPSMGDLTGKLMFVLTGDGDRVTDYITDRSLSAVAFSAANVKNVPDVVDLTRSTPDIGWWAVNDIVFYNQNFPDISNGAGMYASANRYINRVWDGNLFGPETLNNNEYADAIDEDINNIATKLVWATPSPTNNKPPNGIQRPVRAENPLIDNTHVYSTHQNVTQAATQTITATNLIVEQGAHYRMMANDYIDLQPGVDFQSGSDVDVRIDNCEGANANYNLRQSNSNQLTQEQIDALMHELNKDLYGYQPSDEENIESLKTYPNPATTTFNISYRHYSLSQAILTLYDITGRIVKSKIYQPQQEGLQNFTLNINDLNEGTYFYTLKVGETIYNGKVLKIKP